MVAMQVDDVRVRATGKAVPLPEPGELAGDPGPLPKPAQETSIYFQVFHCMQRPNSTSATALKDRILLYHCMHALICPI